MTGNDEYDLEIPMVGRGEELGKVILHRIVGAADDRRGRGVTRR